MTERDDNLRDALALLPAEPLASGRVQQIAAMARAELVQPAPPQNAWTRLYAAGVPTLLASAAVVQFIQSAQAFSKLW